MSAPKVETKVVFVSRRALRTPVGQAQKGAGVGRGFRGQGQEGGCREATLHQPAGYRLASEGGTAEALRVNRHLFGFPSQYLEEPWCNPKTS